MSEEGADSAGEEIFHYESEAIRVHSCRGWWLKLESKRNQSTCHPKKVVLEDKGNTKYQDIFTGTIFGPYMGIFKPVDQYEEESGTAWEILTPNKSAGAGYMDPGVNPSSQEAWVAKVNCSGDVSTQNLVGFQYKGNIFYRVIKPIKPRVELLVYMATSTPLHQDS